MQHISRSLYEESENNRPHARRRRLKCLVLLRSSRIMARRVNSQGCALIIGIVTDNFDYLFMKTTLTPKQALEQIKEGHLRQLKGMDEGGFTHVFDDAKEVILLTYQQESQATLSSVIEENEPEIRKYAVYAKGAMLRLVCGRNHNLLMDDMNIIKTAEDLFPKGTDYSWDVEHTESSDFKLRINLYIIFH